MNSRQQEGLGKIIFGSGMLYFGIPLYLHGMPIDNIGLILIILSLVFLVFGLKNFFYKNTNSKSNSAVWFLTGIIFIGFGVYVYTKINPVNLHCAMGGNLNSWCDVSFLLWIILIPILGLFISLISLLNRKSTKNV